MTKPPVTVAELSPAGGSPGGIRGESRPEALQAADSASPISVEPPEASQAPITTSTPIGERRDKTAAARKARWKRRREDGSCWIAHEIGADLLDVLIASGALPEADRDNAATIAATLLHLAEEGIRARFGTVVSSPASLTGR
jgi:hypothetical protein